MKCLSLICDSNTITSRFQTDFESYRTPPNAWDWNAGDGNAGNPNADGRPWPHPWPHPWPGRVREDALTRAPRRPRRPAGAGATLPEDYHPEDCSGTPTSAPNPGLFRYDIAVRRHTGINSIHPLDLPHDYTGERQHLSSGRRRISLNYPGLLYLRETGSVSFYPRDSRHPIHLLTIA